MKNAIRLDACFAPPSASLAVELQTLHTLKCIQSLASHAKKERELVLATLNREHDARFRMMEVVAGRSHPYYNSMRQAEVILTFGAVSSV